jgi:hypothetical protein
MKSKNKFVKSRWEYIPPTAEEINPEVLTKPNQSMTIRDILFRNTNGMAYNNLKTPYYEDQATFASEPINKIQNMDPTDKMQYLNDISNQVSTLQAKIKSHEEAKAAAAAEVIAKNDPQTETTTTDD